MCSSRPATKTTQLFWSKTEAGVYHKLPSNPVCVCVFAQRPHTMKGLPWLAMTNIPTLNWGQRSSWSDLHGPDDLYVFKNPRAWREWSRVPATTGDLKGSKHLRTSTSCQARGSGFTYLIVLVSLNSPLKQVLRFHHSRFLPQCFCFEDTHMSLDALWKIL